MANHSQLTGNLHAPRWLALAPRPCRLLLTPRFASNAKAQRRTSGSRAVLVRLPVVSPRHHAVTAS